MLTFVCLNRALERIPADIRVEGGVSRMSDPAMIKGIMDTVTIPVMVCFLCSDNLSRLPSISK